MLGKRQKQVLDFIVSYKKKRGIAPSLEEIRKHLRLNSVSTAHYHVKKLQNAGHLQKEYNQARSVDVFEKEPFVKIPLMGTIAAGSPIEAIRSKEHIALPKSKVPNGGNFYALRVSGDSMIEANIDDGDYVVVRSQETAEEGQKVVALVDNYEVTLKTLFREKHKIRLQPANSMMQPIYVDPENLIIQGIVVDIVKNLTGSKERHTRQRKQNSQKDSTLPPNTIIRGDVVEELKKLPDRSVDLIILDPPYWKVVSEHWDYQWRTESDYAKWCFEWFSELSRISKHSGSLYLFGYLRNLFYLYKDILDLGFTFRQQIVIDKGIRAIGGRATKGYKMFPNVTESLLFFIYDSKPFIKQLLKKRQKELGLTALEINTRLGVKTNGGGVWSLYTGNNILAQVPTKEMWEKLQDVLEFEHPYDDIGQAFNIEMGVTDVWRDVDFYKEERFHPTQKPIKLIERIINASTNEGMVVLDPFMGAGSTALACQNLNRNYVGIEIEKKYVDIANQRLAEVSSNQKLF